MIAVDTNVLVRSLTDDDRQQAAVSRSPVETGSVWIAKTAHPLPSFSLPRRVRHAVTLIGRPFEEGTLGRVRNAPAREFGVSRERPMGF